MWCTRDVPRGGRSRHNADVGSEGDRDEDDSLIAVFGRVQSRAPIKDDRLALANAPDTSPTVLSELARAAQSTVRRAVAMNPNASPETLMALAAEFPDEFFANPAFSLFLLENPSWFSEMPEDTTAKLVSHPAMPAGLLIEATRHRAFYVRRAAAQNPRLSPELLVELAEKQSFYEEVAGNPNAPPTYLDALAGHDWVAVRLAVAKNPRVSESALRRLANDGDLKVRRASIGNPAASERLLASLSTHESALVRLAVAESERTPREVLARLENDADGGVRFAAQRSGRALRPRR